MSAYISFLKDEFDKIKKGGSNIFSGDEKIINPYNKSCTDPNKEIKVELLPQPICGNIRNAKIIICSLNPGLGVGDEDIEDKSKAFVKGLPYLRNDILEQLNQDNPKNNFFWITDKAKGTSGYKYWVGKFNQKDEAASLIKNICDKYSKKGIVKKEEDIITMLSESLATVELIPYHSVKMTYDMQRELLECPSVKMLKEFMISEIIPSLDKNNQLLCMMRSFESWEITPDKYGTNKNIIFNPNPRNPSLNVTKDFGQKILEHIGRITNDFTRGI